MKRDDFAAGHRWENKVTEYDIEITHDDLGPINDKDLQERGWTTTMVKVNMTVTTEPPRFV